MDPSSWVNVSPSNSLVDLVNQTPSLILAVPFPPVLDVLHIECRYLGFRLKLAGRLDILRSSVETWTHTHTHTYTPLLEPVLLFWRNCF